MDRRNGVTTGIDSDGSKQASGGIFVFASFYITHFFIYLYLYIYIYTSTHIYIYIIQIK